MNFWEILGISPTTDLAAIRHAYAEKTRACHPEEDPEGFDKLHTAFQEATPGAPAGRPRRRPGPKSALPPRPRPRRWPAPGKAALPPSRRPILPG